MSDDLSDSILLKPTNPLESLVMVFIFHAIVYLQQKLPNFGKPEMTKVCQLRRKLFPDWTKTRSPFQSKLHETHSNERILTRTGIRAVWVGSESHPYAVKPSSTIVAEAIGCSPHIQAGDWEFACKAGTEAMVAAIGFVGSGMARYALAIGSDTAQGRPGDALEYTAAAGGAAFILGPASESLAVINSTFSYVTDTPDFWRRPMQNFPEHGQRFTGDPAYFKHITEAGKHMMEANGTKPEDYKYVVFHQPNTKFPQRVAGMLGFSKEQYKTGLLSPVIGNTYSGASIVGLTAILDEAKPGDRILLVSFGSGAGSDAMDITVTDAILDRQNKALKTQDYISRRTVIDYATYSRYRGNLKMR